MTKHLNTFTYTLLFVLAVVTQPTTLYAEEAAVQSSPLYKFQQKLALKGNTRAQYKLACMYEAGKGVTLDIEQAKLWYDKASKEGMKAAGDRYTYLLVKEQGYDQAMHSSWLDGVKSSAKARDGDAVFLLGQLYREGIGVKKDLNKSLALFEQVSLSGDADVDDEIDMIQAEIAENDKARITAAKKREAARLAQERETEAARLAQARQGQKPVAELPAAAALTQPTSTTPQALPTKVAPVKRVSAKDQQLKQQAQAESLKQAEKIRRYERAMMQLKLEQQKIDEQQAWASGGAAADDEI